MIARSARNWLLLASFALNLVLLGLIARQYLQRGSPAGAPHTRADGSAWLPATEPTRLFSAQRPQPDTTVFLGDSITAHAPWGELFASVLNRGIPGNTTRDVLNRLDEVVARQPRCVVLMIGVNDLLQGQSPDAVASAVATVVTRITSGPAHTMVALISTLPIREVNFPGLENQTIRELNQRLAKLAQPPAIRFVDAFDAFLDSNGQLRDEFTYDGIHLLPAGYWRLRDATLEAAPNGGNCPALNLP